MANKILFVDDEVDIESMVKQYYRRAVKRGEIKLEFAHNGKEALEKLEQIKDIDMVFTDINMPEMDGLTFIKELNEKFPLVKAVVISAYGDMSNIRKAMNFGAFDFTTKPINFDDIHATMEKTLTEVFKKREEEETKEKLLSAQSEIEVGKKIKMSFLPSSLPTVEGYQIDAKFIPGNEIGGDFYDIFYLPDKKRVAFVIADVCDKGVGAALFMALFRSLLRAFSKVDSDSAFLARRIVNKTDVYIQENHGDSGMFATMFFGILDPQSGKIDYVNSGHKPPYILADNSIKEILEPSGPAVGESPFSKFENREYTLQNDETLLLYTKGLPEASDSEGNVYSEERLKSFLSGHFDNVDSLLNETINDLNNFTAGASQTDDITLFALKRL